MNTDTQPATSRPAFGHLVSGLLEELHRYRGDTSNDRQGRFTMLSDVLLRDALRERATDVHLDPEPDAVRVRFRIDGRLHDAASLNRDHGIHLIRHFKAISNLDPVNTPRLADARITYRLDDSEVDLRLACAPTVTGDKASIRILDRGRVEQRLSELGLSAEHHEQIRNWLASASGLFLVVGPTGSGKTTTAYALLHELREKDRSIVTIEDPVEYRVPGISQIAVDHHRDMGFAEVLKGVLRLDPDYVLVGEIRDGATAHAAVDAGASGRILMTTMHSPDAVGAITALRNRDVSDEGIAGAVTMIVAQRLVRRLCPHCRRRQPPTALDCKWLKAIGVNDDVGEVWAAQGCDLCRGVGYRGRVGVFELWQVTEAEQSLLLDHASPAVLRDHLRESGFRTLANDGWAKAAAGVTSVPELRVLGNVRQR